MAPRDLEYSGKLSHKEYLGMRNHLRFIWLVRNHLHQLSGRKNDRLDFEYQEKIARDWATRIARICWRSRNSWEISTRPMASIKSLNRAFVRTHLPNGRSLWKGSEPFDVGKGLHFHQGEIGFKSATDILSDPFLLMTIFEQSSRTKCPLSMEARRLVTEFLSLVDDGFRRAKKSARSFLNIINNTNAFEVLIQMHEAGFLSSFIPEFAKITNRVQFDAYHTFRSGDIPSKRSGASRVSMLKKRFFSSTSFWNFQTLNRFFWRGFSMISARSAQGMRSEVRR